MRNAGKLKAIDKLEDLMYMGGQHLNGTPRKQNG
jgi:hypothetical protein